MRGRMSSVGLVLLGIASVQLGAGVAKSMFDELSPAAMVWLRLVTSTVVFLVWARPRWRGRDRHDWWTVVGFGLCLGGMNIAIYQSFARIPIGIAVTIEFIGPLLIAVFGFRRPRDLVWVGLAALGVALLGFERAELDLVGVLYAVLAGAAWAGYILLSARTGQRWEGLDGLAFASLVALGLATLVWVLDSPAGTSAVLDWRLLGLGAAVGLLSSVVPYSAELVALRSLPTALVSVLMSLEPAAAALAGLLVVNESLSTVQWLAIGCVVVASFGATRVTTMKAGPEPAVAG